MGVEKGVSLQPARTHRARAHTHTHARARTISLSHPSAFSGETAAKGPVFPSQARSPVRLPPRAPPSLGRGASRRARPAALPGGPAFSGPTLTTAQTCGSLRPQRPSGTSPRGDLRRDRAAPTCRDPRAGASAGRGGRWAGGAAGARSGRERSPPGAPAACAPVSRCLCPRPQGPQQPFLSELIRAGRAKQATSF